MGISYEPIENQCGHAQSKGSLIIDFDGKWLCEDCFLEILQDHINNREVEILADLVMSDYWEAE